MGAKGVILAHAAPVRVDNGLALGLGADAIAPVVGIGKAAARPAQHGDMDVLQGIDDVAAHAVDIGDLGILAHIKALIDAAAQMLRELAVNVGINGANGTVGVDKNMCHRFTLLYKWRADAGV